MSANPPQPPTNPGHDLPEYWWYDLDDATFDGIFAEARLRAAEIREFASQRERRVALLVAWAFALVGAARLAGALDPATDLGGILSWIALALTVMAISSAFWYVVPRAAHIGVDPRWLAVYAHRLQTLPPDLRIDRLARGEILAELLAAYAEAEGDLKNRSRAYRAISWLAPLQAAAVAAVLISHFA